MDDAPEPRWPAPWLRAALGTAILATLEPGPLHGYAIATALEARGMGRPRGGSLYPLLAQLDESGAVETAWAEGEGGPGRRTYALTSDGRERLARERTDWQGLVEALHTTTGRTTT